MAWEQPRRSSGGAQEQPRSSSGAVRARSSQEVPVGVSVGLLDECIVRPPFFSTLGGTICRMYRAPAPFFRTWKECSRKQLGENSVKKYYAEEERGKVGTVREQRAKHSSQVRKGAGARYIRQILPSGPSRGVPSMGGTPRRAPKRSILPFKRAILSTLWLGGKNPSLDCSWPAPGCFRRHIVREWAQVAEKSARVSILREKNAKHSFQM